MSGLVATPRLILAAQGLLAIVTIAATLHEAGRHAFPGFSLAANGAAFAGAALALYTARNARRWSRPLAGVGQRLDTLPAAGALAAIVGAGVALRWIAASTIGAVVTDSGAADLELAARLLAGSGAADPGGVGIARPPGYAFSLAASGLLFGLSPPGAAIAAVNIIAFAVTAPAAYLIGRWLRGRGVGLAAAALLAVWPNLVLGASSSTGTLLALALLTAFALTYVAARRSAAADNGAAHVAAALACGLALGCAGLVQPAWVLLLAALLLAEVVQHDRPRLAAVRVVAVSAGLVLASTPWLAWNAAPADIVVTAVTGGSARALVEDPAAAPTRDRAGRADRIAGPESGDTRPRLALDEIARQPHRVLARWWQGLLRFSGDDSTFAGEPRRADADAAPARPAAAAISNAAWLGIWLLVLVAVAQGTPGAGAVAGGWLAALAYLATAAGSSIAGGDPLDHVPLAGLLAVVAASALAGKVRPVRDRATPAPPRRPLAQFVDFAAVGAVGTAAHFVTLILLVQSAAWVPVIATTAGFLVGALVNYVLNYHLTFESETSHAVALPRFLAIAFLSMLLNVGIFWALVHWQGLHYVLGQLVATAIVLVVNFVANRALTFSQGQATAGRGPR